MKELEIQGQPRTVTGKKVRFLRREGSIPANIFGHGIKSQAIQVDGKQLDQVLARAGTSRLIAVRLPRERDARRVLVREVKRDPVTQKLMHVSFYQVRMTEKLKAEVHLIFAGEAPAVGVDGMLLRPLTSVTVESLPADLPEAITVDLSSLEEVDDAIHVRDLPVPEGVTILTDPDELVAKVSPIRVEKEVVEEAAALKPEAEAPDGAVAPAKVEEKGEEE